jgi:hypothetical protein
MVGADSVKSIVGESELDLSSKKRRITCERLVQQIDCASQILRLNCTEAYTESEILGPAIEFKTATSVVGRCSIAFFSLGDNLACN